MNCLCSVIVEEINRFMQLVTVQRWQTAAAGILITAAGILLIGIGIFLIVI